MVKAKSAVKSVKHKNYRIFNMDCIKLMKGMARKGMQVDSIVSDSPYNLASVVKRFGGKNAAPAKFGKDGAFSRASAGFMGKTWDSDVAFQAETWAAAYEILKPGGHMLVFGGTRTYHRLVCAIEDAGFEIRDSLMWLYGSGMPHSHNVSMAIDKAVRGVPHGGKDPTSPNHGNFRRSKAEDGYSAGPGGYMKVQGKANARSALVPEAQPYIGWGTALKPATEIICLARKPLSEKTIVANVLKHGTGAINIDACRVGTTKRVPSSLSKTPNTVYGKYNLQNGSESGHNPNIGRWPANVITDGSDEVISSFPEKSSVTGKRSSKSKNNKVSGTNWLPDNHKSVEHTDSGSPARFFYSAKSGKKDRNFGLPDGTRNPHPTVKPLALMTYLIKLITPVGGTTFDPFMGSGSTGIAAIQSGFKFVGSDLTEEYFDISAKRIAYAAGIENNEDRIKTKEITFLDEPENFISPKDWTKRGLKNQSKG